MPGIHIKSGKDILPQELAELMKATGQTDIYSETDIEKAIDAYPLTIQARNKAGDLIAYLSAFSDGVFSTVISKLLVHPDYQRLGIGAALLKQVERRYPNIPIQAHCSSKFLPFFSSQGYSPPAQDMRIISKNKTRGQESVIAWT